MMLGGDFQTLWLFAMNVALGLIAGAGAFLLMRGVRDGLTGPNDRRDAPGGGEDAP